MRYSSTSSVIATYIKPPLLSSMSCSCMLGIESSGMTQWDWFLGQRLNDCGDEGAKIKEIRKIKSWWDLLADLYSFTLAVFIGYMSPILINLANY